mgnify:CR=1 FL=1
MKKSGDSHQASLLTYGLLKFILIMRLSTFLIFFTVLQVFASGTYSQNTHLTINVNDITIEEILDEIEKKSDFYFLFNQKLVDVNRKVNLHVENKKLDDILPLIFAGTKVDYVILDKQIVLSKIEYLSEIKNSQQPSTVKGMVLDVDGNPMPGVSILVKGTSQGTVTNFNGEYQIDIDNPQSAILVFSFIGCLSQEITVGNKNTIDITLEPDILGLEEVIVVGYGVQKKSDITGSVASVTSEDLEKTASFSPALALQGRAAGVSIVRTSGSPEATASIRIRGVGTTNNTSPLFVVDGLPVSDIDFLNPKDIASMEVLKDASASAIYGSRGANGVILVTTKKGEAGKLQVSFDASYGVEHLPEVPDMLNAQQYAELSNEAFQNSGQPAPYANPASIDQYTNWFNEISQTGLRQNYDISLSGGSERFKGRLSANYYNRQGIIRKTEYERFTFQSNSSVKATDFLSFETSLTGVFAKPSFSYYGYDPYDTPYRLDPTVLFLNSLMAPPDIPVIDPDTDYFSGITKMRFVNPVGWIERNHDEFKNKYIVGNITANMKITEGLDFISRIGINHRVNYNSTFTPSFFETPDISAVLSTVSRSALDLTDWTWENILQYSKSFQDAHNISLMGAISSREFYSDAFSASGQAIPIERKEFWYLSASTQVPQVSGTGESLSMLSYLGRFNYNFKNRYLITASYRADGSSRFIEENRWGYFPSGAVAWRISEEDFFKSLDLSFLSNIKIRASYGEIGNENVFSYYPYLTPIAQQYYYTLGDNQDRINGAGLTGIGNPDVRWETTTQFNAGIDLSLLAGRITFTGDYYIKTTEDILLAQQIPRVSGTTSIIRNVGIMENRGFEFVATYREIKNTFKYDISINFSTVNNQVLDLGTNDELVASMPYYQYLIDLQPALGSMLRSVVGEPYQQFYGWKRDGIFQNQEEINAYTYEGVLIQPDAQPGDFKFVDINNDGVINDLDKTSIGSPWPDFTFGLSFSASYKQFDMNLLIQGQFGNELYNAADYYLMRFDGRSNVKADYLDKYWDGEGSSNTHAAVTSDLVRNSYNYRNSDFYVEDASFARIRNLQLGYTLTPNIGGTNYRWRIYLASENLLTLTKYSGFEPEIAGDVPVDRGTYPQSRLFMLGANISF